MMLRIRPQYKDLAVLLHAARGVGPNTVVSILEHLNKNRIEAHMFRPQALYSSDELLVNKKQFISIKKIFNEYSIDSYRLWLKSQSIHVSVQGDTAYPSQLTKLAQPPVILYAQGVWPLPNQVALAVVGARHCTPYGVRATRRLIHDCCSSGVGTIVSGLMYGIDAVAHQVAVSNGTPTIAVLGYGFGGWFPSRMQKLALDIIAGGGTVVTEYAPAMLPTKGTFLERNRIIAGLSDAVLVPEAAARSGTQRTVAIAAEMGIPVGAVPGPFDSEYSEGTKTFVNQGATLVSSAEDILNELGITKVIQQHRQTEPVHEIERQLQSGPCTTDELCLTTQLSVVQLSFELSSLELAGRIVRRGAQWYRA